MPWRCCLGMRSQAGFEKKAFWKSNSGEEALANGRCKQLCYRIISHIPSQRRTSRLPYGFFCSFFSLGGGLGVRCRSRADMSWESTNGDRGRVCERSVVILLVGSSPPISLFSSCRSLRASSWLAARKGAGEAELNVAEESWPRTRDCRRVRGLHVTRLLIPSYYLLGVLL